MKIMITCGTLLAGGAERVISILANAFAETGHQVEILPYYNSEVWYDIVPEVRILPEQSVIKSRGKAPLQHILWRRKHIRQEQPDVIISFMGAFNMMTILAAMGLHVPVIAADRSDPRYSMGSRVLEKVRNLLYGLADHIVLQSRYNQSYFSQRIQKKSSVIMNPIDPSEIHGMAVKTPKQKKIVAVGRLISVKNPEMAANAMEIFLQKHPDYQLVVYGDGDLRETMIRSAADKGLQDALLYPGQVKDVYSHILDAQAYILTSDYEGMPNSLMEAMYAGLPVISTRVSGAADLIRDGENGYLVDCGDAEAMASRLCRIVEDPEQSKSMGQKAALSVECLHTDKILQKWEKLIADIVKKEK